jgi:SAM-dependent methyltransferase
MPSQLRQAPAFDCETTRVACRLCGGELGAPLLVHTERDRFEIAAGIASENYRRCWRRCVACDAVQDVYEAGNEQKLEALSSSYYEVDLGDNICQKFDRVMAMPALASDNAGRVTRILNFVGRRQAASASRHAIDIGAGLGVFLARFLAEGGPGWRVTAIEPDPNAARHLRSLDAFGVVEAIFTGDEKEIADADLITLNKVAEHIPYPLPLLEACRRKLTREGILYVEVPDEWTIGRRPPNDNILGALHKHLYAPRSLTGLIERAGLTVLRVGRVFEPSGKISVFAFACP